MKAKYVVGLALCLALLGVILLTCSSDPTGDDNKKEQLIKYLAAALFTPNSGPPGTPVLINSMVHLPEEYEWGLTIGGVPVPLLTKDSISYLTAIPLIYDPSDSTWPIVPDEPLTVVLYCDSVPIDSLTEVITVHELEHADGALDSIIQNLQTGISAFKDIAGGTTFVDSQMQVFLKAFDTMLVDGENSLTSFLNGTATLLPCDSVPKDIIDALCASSGLADAIKDWSGDAVELKDALVGGKRLNYGQAAPGEIYDGEDLAFKMQLQAYMAEFGRTFLSPTNATWSEFTTILGLIGIVAPLPAVAQAIVEVVSFVLNIAEFVINKILVGILPGELTALELDFQDHMVNNGDETWSIIYISAKNDSVAIGVQDIISQVLNAASFAKWLKGSGMPPYLMSDEQFLNDLMQEITYWILGVIRSIQSSMNLPDLTERIPEITWDSLRIYNPDLVELTSYNVNLFTPIDNSLNWLASDTATGWGHLSVQTSTGGNSWIHPALVTLGYHGGTFGDEVKASNIDSIRVVPELYLTVTFPSTIDSGGSGELWARAGYVQQGGVNYTSGIHISLGVSGGSAASSSGVTDESGYFYTTISHDETSEEIVVGVTATGDEGSYAFKQVSADVQSDLMWACANKLARFADSTNYSPPGWFAVEYSPTVMKDTVKAYLYLVVEFEDWPDYFSHYLCWEYVLWEGDGFTFKMAHTSGVMTSCLNKCVHVSFIDAGHPDTCGCEATLQLGSYPNQCD